jgi:alkylation response protein AidB-like acyl-CoA dehydrogenase
MPAEQTLQTTSLDVPSLDVPSLDVLCARLHESAAKLDAYEVWPTEQLAWCAESGVFRWFIDEQHGGSNWSDVEIIEGYLALSQACLTTTFILTQWSAACRRIATSANRALSEKLLPRLATGELFVTVGISHLSTSRQHSARPALTAQRRPDGSYVLNGYSAWVTGGAYADYIVVGATLPDGNQVLCCVPRMCPGLTTYLGQRLVALTSSCTDKIELQNVIVQPADVLAGPVANVMQSGGGGGTGGLQTSTLAVGLAIAASKYLKAETAHRRDIADAAQAIESETRALRSSLIALANGEPTSLTASDLRGKANSLVLRATQAALTVAKGAGFAAENPVGRWAKEALFFLVWSCPQPVLDANLTELTRSDSENCSL